VASDQGTDRPVHGGWRFIGNDTDQLPRFTGGLVVLRDRLPSNKVDPRELFIGSRWLVRGRIALEVPGLLVFYRPSGEITL
jgi:hypothetical protein